MQRKKPFSGKKKKEQLKERRARKAESSDRAEGNVHKNVEKEEEEDNEEDRDIEEDNTTSHSEDDNNNSNEDNKEKKNKKKKKGNNSNILTPETVIIPTERFPRNKLVTIFEKETKEEVEERRRKGYLPLNMYHRDHPWWENIESETVLEMPKRPSWAHSMSADSLDDNERKNYEDWMRNLLHLYGPRLNYFEKNLEVWRQLWRVVERSDVILLVVDARFPLFHYPPSLYDYVVKELKKPIILVLNKADIVDKRIVDAWELYFLENFPSLSVVRFSSFRPMAEGALEIEKKRKLEKGRRKYENAGGRRTLLEAVRKLNIKKNGKIVDIPELTFVPSQNDDDDEDESDSDDSEAEEVDEEEEKKRDYDSVITIGTVGHPNVGKSSLINGLVGKKVVSTSRTPGHTKHFQTIFLTPEILLCDCPGLVFPALDRPKDLQVLCGVFPIAQVREVFSAIRYLAERVPIEKVYNLKPPEDNEPWSPYNICESYATKRGYLVARTGAPDVHRAGGEILKDCLDGNIVISWPPPGRSDILIPTPAPETVAKIKGGDDSEDSDGEPKNSFRENQKKKREKKMKKKQKALEGEEDEKPKKTAVTGKPKPKKPAKKQDDDDDDKPSYYEKMEAKAKRSNKHQTLGEI